MTWAWIVAALLVPALGVGGAAYGAESDPLPVPKGGARARAVVAYNDGVKLMVEKRYAAAQRKFEEALAADERLAEAHNNLAFSLRMQGPANAQRALKHYDRALQLKPDLARAYMYRGVLYTQLGNVDGARADHGRLLTLDPALAAKLEAVIAGRASDDGTEGLTGQYD
ncbi:MAG: tetratricopeptide repeat protein [Candidatus Rokuibacteriota bacterium]